MTKIQMRRGNSAQWSAQNSVLGSGESGFDTDLKDSKIGDGVTAWKGLPFSRPGIVYAPPPNGVDDTTALTAFFNANVGRTKHLYSGGIYKVTGILPNPGKLVGNNAVFDCQGMADGTALGQRYCIKATGTKGTATTISTALDEGEDTIVVASAAGLTVGKWVLISNTEQPVPGMTRADRVKGEMALISAINGTTITLDSGLYFSYGTAGLKLEPLSTVDDVDISDLQIVMGGVGSTHNAIAIRYGSNVTLDRLKINGAEEIAISLEAVSGFNVTRCRNADSTSSQTYGLSGYGVALMDGTQHGNVSDCNFRNNRHHVAGGGTWPTIFVNVLDNHGVNASSGAWDCHESTFDWTFRGNTAVKATHGIYVRGQRITVEDNKFRNISAEAMSAKCWDDVTEQREIRFINNSSRNCGWGLSMGSAGNAPTHRLKDIEVRGNKFVDCGTNPIRIDMFDGAIVEDNNIQGTTVGSAIKITGGNASNRSTDLKMGNNTIKGGTGLGIEIAYVDGVQMANDKVSNQAFTGIQLNSCLAIVMTGMHVRNGAGANSDAIRILDSDGVSITGGYLKALRWAAYITGTNNVVITGVNAKDTVQGPKFNVDAAATNKLVSGNIE